MERVLPIAAVINDQIFCVHGGLCPELKTLQQLETCDKDSHLCDKKGVLSGILWSDPHESNEDFLPSCRDNYQSTIFTWGPAVTSEFLKQNKLSTIVRAHQQVAGGYKKHHYGSVITVFSSSNYDFGGGDGAYIIWNCESSKSAILRPKFVKFNTTALQQERRKM